MADWEQPPLDLNIEDRGRFAPSVKHTRAKQKGYVRQTKSANPPMCPACIEEFNRKERTSVPNRVTHHIFESGWEEARAVCVIHAMEHAERLGINFRS